MHPIEIANKAATSFSLPEVCLRLREMLDDHRTDAEDIGNLVSLDPSLTSKLLKLANSPLFRFRSQVDSITKAVNILGGEALYNLVMAETAKSAFEHFSSDHINLHRFWQRSLYTGLIAKHIAKLQRIRGSERYFLLGLLQNLAELVITKELPDKAFQCEKLIDTSGKWPWEIEKQVLGFTYTQCSAEILQLWHLPTQIWMPLVSVNKHSTVDNHEDVAILVAAMQLTHLSMHDKTIDFKEVMASAGLEQHSISEEIVQDALSFSHQEIAKMMAIFSG